MLSVDSHFSRRDTIAVRSKALVLGDVGSGKTRFCRGPEDTAWPTSGYEYHQTRHEEVELRLSNGLCYSYDIEISVAELSGPRAGELARAKRREFTSSFLYVFVYRPGTLDRIWTYWLPLVLAELEEERTERFFPVFVEARVDEDKSGATPTALRMRSEIAIYQKLGSSRFLYFQTSGSAAESQAAWTAMARQLAVCDLWERGFLPRHTA